MTSGRILVPLDGSAESYSAVPLARTLATATQASITLLQVRTANDHDPARCAQMNLQHIADELTASGVQTTAVVRYGHAAEQILDEIAGEPVGMIVMRTHGRAGLERSILGSVTQQILSQTRVPMVLVRPGERRVSHIQKLLVPVDGSRGGEAALTAAEALVAQTGAALHVLEVVVPLAMRPMVADSYGMGYYDPAWDEDTVKAAKDYVHTLVKQLRQRGLQVQGESCFAATVDEAVTEAAERHGVDLVVMSTHALTGPARAVLGSVSDAVVRSAPCPVLLVHRSTGPEAEDAPAPAAASSA